jgi:hypothetical protein
MAFYRAEQDKAVAAFDRTTRGTPFEAALRQERLMSLVSYWEDYKAAKMAGGGGDAAAHLNAEYQARHPLFHQIVQPGKDKTAVQANRAFQKLYKARKGILREMRKERIDNSFLGHVGRWLEPVTRWAGFNWRVNVSLLSALAAKESSVATLGALYEPEEEGEALETRMARGEKAFTDLHALALMLFMVLYPPLPGHGHCSQAAGRQRPLDALFDHLPHVAGAWGGDPGLHRRQYPGLERVAGHGRFLHHGPGPHVIHRAILPENYTIQIEEREMRRPPIIFSGILAMGLICSGNALAHTPLCSCYENGAIRGRY